ncbi:MAG: TolC family protein, partial [Nitrospirota bacterium]
MTWSIRFWLLAITVVSLAFWTSERHIAYAVDQTPQPSLVLSDLIQEALVRNPEIAAARKQWEAASQRIAQARTLDDPTLSVQWWNAPESFNLGRSENTIVGLSQKLPFPGKLALKEDVAGRSADISEQ